MPVYVVDDDTSLREALGGLLRSAAFEAVLLGSAQEFLEQRLPEQPCCLILDVQLPGASGLDLQTELAAAHIQIPIIFISGRSGVPQSVQAMKGGALEFLVKPLQEEKLLAAVTAALTQDRQRLAEQHALDVVRARYDTLTGREQEVMGLVTTGLLNKQIAAEMGIAEKTVKVHRCSVTRKLGVRSVAELVRMADRLGVGKSKG